MRLVFVACFTVSLLSLIAVRGVRGARTSSLVKGNQTPSGPAKNYADNMMVCNLIQDSHVSEAIKTLEMKFEKLTELVNKSSTSQPKPRVFTLMFGSQKIPVYCHMGNFGCGDGGWTLAMKIDGTKEARLGLTYKRPSYRAT
ncbi:putative skeletal organic matrix protein 5 [Oculina patagonica]